MTELESPNLLVPETHITRELSRQRLQFEDLPREILGQVFRYTISIWSLRIDRHTRHACGHQAKNETWPTKSVTYYVKHAASPDRSIICKESTIPHDINGLIRISKYISTVARVAQLDAFSGILEVRHSVVKLNWKIGEENKATSHGCPCFSAAERVNGLRAALGNYASRVSAYRLGDWGFDSFDFDLPHILPMSRIACIDSCNMLMNLSFDPATYPDSMFRLGTISDTDLVNAFWTRVFHNPNWRPSFPGDTIYVDGYSYPGRAIRVTHMWSVNMIVETTIRAKGSSEDWKPPDPGSEYFYVAFLLRKEGENDPLSRVLARHTREEGEALELDDRLKLYIQQVQRLL